MLRSITVSNGTKVKDIGGVLVGRFHSTVQAKNVLVYKKIESSKYKPL